MGQKTNDFIGTERFKIRRRLGSGGMGVVYEAHDRHTDKVVALKALTRTEASHISRFKNEFRSLADVSHPNLVTLHEFMSDGKYWFFTMELVDGVNFLEYVRPGYKSRRSQSSISPTLLKDDAVEESESSEAVADYEAETQQLNPIRATLSEDAPSEISIDTRLAKSRLDLYRLETAIRQLAEGLQALHETGKLHRDIKPSNVLITKLGRVVILDFGLVADVEAQGLHDSFTLAGTPDYMSPEQGAQLPISTASDWYSVGVMLYQALTGQLPFTGKFFEVMFNKQSLDPPSPLLLAPDVPPELDELCMKLLARDPAKRPSGRELLRAFSHGKTGPLGRPVMPASISTSLGDVLFVGRQPQMQELNNAFDTARRGQTVTVYLHGESGMGKTALVRQFLDHLRDRENRVVILEGRCYERESVPFKALDGVVDSLTKYLMALSEARAEALLPRDVPALARLFPVMLQVDSIFNAPQREQETPDPFTLRRRAFAALRELLGRIADRQPLVVHIDDLQWSDADSITLLEEIFRPPEAPPLLLIASFRSEDLETKAFLRILLNKAVSETCRQLQVTALTKEEARNLAQNLIGPNLPSTGPIVNSIIREAHGSPFLLEQLARYASSSEQTATTGISLGVMLVSRLRHLPKGTRQFIETLAVAGRPINPEVVYQAAGLSGDELPLVSSLRAAQFLRGGDNYTIELYHDRIRETVASQLEPGTVMQIHRRLAHALEARGIDDPEALFEHYLGAGERVRAATHAEVAAKKAANALAFDRAAAFYRRALELAPSRGAELIDLKRGLAESLVNAGRPAEAAQAYLDVAQETSASHSLDFRRRAAEQLLMGGHIKEGLDVLRSVLASVGMTLPAGPKRALLSLILRRIQIRLRGLKFKERQASEIPQADLMRIDICWAVAAGLGAVDLIRGADFQSRHLLLALRAGEPFRLAKAMAFEAAQTAARGSPTRKRAVQIAHRAEELAQKVDHPHAIGLSIWASGVAAYLVGHWKNAAMLCERAVEVLRDQCTGVMWELTIAQRFMLSALLYMGEVPEVSRRVPGLLAAALEQGNLFAAVDLRTRLNLIWLAADDPTRARAEVIEALKDWYHEGFHLQHYTAVQALVQIELYTGDAEVAWRHIERQWKDLENSMLMRIQILRIDAMHLLARGALASAPHSPERDRRLRTAEKLAQRIAGERIAWATPFAYLIRAGVAHQRGDNSRAASLLSQAIESFDLADLDLYEAAARRRLGEITEGERGLRNIAEADAWMRKRQIQNPEAMTRLLAPGFD